MTDIRSWNREPLTIPSPMTIAAESAALSTQMRAALVKMNLQLQARERDERLASSIPTDDKQPQFMGCVKVHQRRAHVVALDIDVLAHSAGTVEIGNWVLDREQTNQLYVLLGVALAMGEPV